MYVYFNCLQNVISRKLAVIFRHLDNIPITLFADVFVGRLEPNRGEPISYLYIPGGQRGLNL
jgi:hypothetical protein